MRLLNLFNLALISSRLPDDAEPPKKDNPKKERIARLVWSLIKAVFFIIMAVLVWHKIGDYSDGTAKFFGVIIAALSVIYAVVVIIVGIGALDEPVWKIANYKYRKK